MKRDRQHFVRAKSASGSWLRFGRRVLILSIAFIVAMELVARHIIGLGDPVLYRADAQIEYLLAPSSTYHRYGHVIRCNAYSMRSDDFTARKQNDAELRVMVIGDSVVNGGAAVDQNDLATELLKRELSAKLNRPVIVGNIAAGGWSPDNELAYARQFGLFDADVVIVVLNTSDLVDPPLKGSLGPDTPVRKPVLALEEAVRRGLPWLTSKLVSPAPISEGELNQISRDQLNALCELLELAKSSGANVLVVQHAKQHEVGPDMTGRHFELAQAVRECGVESVFTGPAYERADDRRGGTLFRDEIHLNTRGQQVLGQVLVDNVMRLQNADQRFAARGAWHLASARMP